MATAKAPKNATRLPAGTLYNIQYPDSRRGMFSLRQPFKNTLKETISNDPRPLVTRALPAPVAQSNRDQGDASRVLRWKETLRCHSRSRTDRRGNSTRRSPSSGLEAKRRSSMFPSNAEYSSRDGRADEHGSRTFTCCCSFVRRG